MSTRETRQPIDSGQIGWDGKATTNFQILLDRPLPIAELDDDADPVTIPPTLDETDLEATFSAATHRNSFIWVYTTGLVWVLYYSDGVAWAPWVSTLSAALNSGVAATTMSGNQTLTSASQPIQFDDPNGGNRDVTLAASNHVFGRQLTVVHTGSANTLTVKDSGGGTLATLSKGQTGIFTRDVSAWRTRTTIAKSGAIIEAPLIKPGSSDATVVFTDNDNVGGVIGRDNTGTAIWDILEAGYVRFGSRTALDVQFHSNGSERGRVTSAGRWLFGTTTDDGSSRVQVNGIIRAVGAGGAIYTDDITDGAAHSFAWYTSGHVKQLYSTFSNSNVMAVTNAGRLSTPDTAAFAALGASSLLFSGPSKELTSTIPTGCISSANLRTMLTDDNGIAGPAIFSDARAVSGSRGGNAALADLLTKLAELGIITDSTS